MSGKSKNKEEKRKESLLVGPTEVDEEKMKVIQDWSTPKIVKGVRSFHELHKQDKMNVVVDALSRRHALIAMLERCLDLIAISKAIEL
ncbi:hypothetical protein CR513_35185, partial [Mucuna pruriens]